MFVFTTNAHSCRLNSTLHTANMRTGHCSSDIRTCVIRNVYAIQWRKFFSCWSSSLERSTVCTPGSGLDVWLFQTMDSWRYINILYVCMYVFLSAHRTYAETGTLLCYCFEYRHPRRLCGKICIITAVMYWMKCAPWNGGHHGLSFRQTDELSTNICTKNNFHISIHNDLDLWSHGLKLALSVTPHVGETFKFDLMVGMRQTHRDRQVTEMEKWSGIRIRDRITTES